MLQESFGKRILRSISVLILIGIVVASFIVTFRLGETLERYRVAAEDPLMVDAVITHYREYDDEGDLDYYSYVAYTVDGVEYTGIRYQHAETKDDLLPIGMVVTFAVSSEEPVQTLSSLKTTGALFYCMLATCCVFLSFGWQLLWRWGRSRGNDDSTVRKNVHRDLRMTILGREGLPFFALAGLAELVAALRFDQCTGSWIWVVTGFFLSMALWMGIVMLRDLGRLWREEYCLETGVLFQKETKKNMDNKSYYYLNFRSDSRQWHTPVKKKYYEWAQEGNRVWVVYMDGHTKPILHYDMLGNAR